MEQNLKYEYLDIKKISELTGISCNALKKRCKKGRYQVRLVPSQGGDSGYKYEILVSSLEYELQNKIIVNSKDFLYATFSEDDNTNSCLQNPPILLDSNTNFDIYSTAVINCNTANNDSPFFQKTMPESAKKLALAKYDLISNWQDYRSNYENKKQADIDYIKAYNNNLIAQELYKTVGKISKSTLYRWHKTLKENNNNYISLINNYNYSGESQLNTTLSNLEKQEFIKLYYNDAKLNIATAYNLLKIKLEKQGIKIKSIATFRRFADYIKRNHKDFETLSRFGEKALKDIVAPFNKRDVSDIFPGDCLVADGNKLDFMVINPYTGKPARAIWVVFFDWKSFDVAGYEIMLTENTQNISSALRNAIIRMGKIPKKVYMDNGRAFRGKYFSGCKDFNQCGFKGIYHNLGIKEVVAQPYSGRSKIVERFFRDFVQSCPPLISSYTGNSIANKPAHLMRNEKFHKELHKNDIIPTIEQAKIIIETWLNEYHRKRPCPYDKSKTIAEMFEMGKGKGVDIEMLDELMMSECIRKAKRNMVKLFGLEYECDELYGLDDKFVIKYSLFDISKIKIYSLKGEYIGEAHTVEPVKAFAKDGSAVDLYNYRMKQKKYNQMLKNTINKTQSLIGKNPFNKVNFAQISENKVIDIEQKENNKKRKKYEITCYSDAHLYRENKRKLVL